MYPYLLWRMYKSLNLSEINVNLNNIIHNFFNYLLHLVVELQLQPNIPDSYLEYFEHQLLYLYRIKLQMENNGNPHIYNKHIHVIKTFVTILGVKGLTKLFKRWLSF
jgi:hypothetical protein